ncbi:MAG: type II toxin-antitoxin system RelE/ParE family toxin [Prevotellaceae bacterium]|nr:type II toxin-antitoxin system RelE/ParE family toxin [Candidatus Colivivens equi]
MKLKWSQHAYESLTDVLDYSYENFGYLQQLTMEEIIMSSIDKLVDFPNMCPVIPEISNNVREYRKLVVTREISVIYWYDEEFVYVSFIWDIRRSLHHIYYIFKND